MRVSLTLFPNSRLVAILQKCLARLDLLFELVFILTLGLMQKWVRL